MFNLSKACAVLLALTVAASAAPAPCADDLIQPTVPFLIENHESLLSGAAYVAEDYNTQLTPDQQEYLNWHNVVRRQHHAADLTWSTTLENAAKTWASKCVFQHSGGKVGPYGENLYAGSGKANTVKKAVQAWTDEVSQYNPRNPQPSHYTQVVWKSTTQVGCAMVFCPGIFPTFGGGQFYVCEYSPQGNVIGRFPQNVQ